MYRYIIYIHISPPLVHANPHTRWLNEAGDSQIHRSFFIYIGIFMYIGICRSLFIGLFPPINTPHTRWLNEAGDSQIHRSLFIYIVKRPAYTCMKRDLHIPIYMKRDLYICTHTP